MEITWSTRPELPGSSCGPNTQGRKRAASKHIENNEGRKRQGRMHKHIKKAEGRKRQRRMHKHIKRPKAASGRECQAGNALVYPGQFVIMWDFKAIKVM